MKNKKWLSKGRIYRKEFMRHTDNVAAGARVPVRAARREPNTCRNHIADGAAPNTVAQKVIVQKVIVAMFQIVFDRGQLEQETKSSLVCVSRRVLRARDGTRRAVRGG
jgi:hypothetical protein